MKVLLSCENTLGLVSVMSEYCWVYGLVRVLRESTVEL